MCVLALSQPEAPSNSRGQELIAALWPPAALQQHCPQQQLLKPKA